MSVSTIPTSTTIPPCPVGIRKSKPFFTGRMPLPPSVNGAYQVISSRNGAGRIGPTPALIQFKLDAAQELCLATVDQPLIDAIRVANTRRKKVPMVVELRVYYKSAWKRDLDGPEKFAVDAAFEYLGLNDNQIVDKHTTKAVDVSDPRVEIEIYCELPYRGTFK